MMINEITSTDEATHKRFIFRGLVENEVSFRLSLQDETTEGFPTRDTPYSFTLGAYSDADGLMGVVSFKREAENRTKLAHKGLLFRMYVANEYAGQGIAKALITALLARVRTLSDIEQINLTVVASNERAKRLYQTLGFQVFGLVWNPTLLRPRRGILMKNG